MLLRLAAIVLLSLALVCAASPTTIAGADWQVWTIAGLLAWCADGLGALPIVSSGRRLW